MQTVAASGNMMDIQMVFELAAVKEKSKVAMKAVVLVQQMVVPRAVV